MLCGITAGARLSATQKEMPRSHSGEFNDELQSEDRYIQVGGLVLSSLIFGCSYCVGWPSG